MICEYGCGQEAKYQFGNGKWCCSCHWNACPKVKESKIGKKRSEESKKRMSDSHIGKEPANKGKTYEELFGIDKAEELKKISREFGKTRVGELNAFYGRKHSDVSKRKQREKRQGKTYEEIYGEDTAKRIKEYRSGKTYEEIYGEEKAKIIKNKQSNSRIERCYHYNKHTIEILKEKYPFFCLVEEMRYNPDKPVEEKEIQVHCKNHKCPNSKEQNGWFTPTYFQMYERIRQVDMNGVDYAYLYCSDECKLSCYLYKNKGADPFRGKGNKEQYYTQEEYKTFRNFVLERDNYKCQYCGEKAEHVHHERPQKLEPFFALDPDYAWSVCQKCHYEKGHSNEGCKTSDIAGKQCSK